MTVSNENWEELLPAYYLGLTDPDETALVEAMLVDEPEEAADYRALAEALLLAVPPVAPPPHLRANLMKATRSPVQFSWRERLLLLGAAVMFMVLFAFNLFTLAQLNGLQQQVNEREALLRQFANQDIVTFTLVDQRNTSQAAWGEVLCNPEETVGIIRVENFPAQAESVPIWLWQNGERIQAGTLEIDDTGAGTAVVHAPERFGNYRYAVVGDAVLRAALYSDDL